MSLNPPFLNNALKQNKILVVEDNPLIQFALKSMLQQLDYDFDLAVNGFEALQLAEKTSDYSIVFMDIDLPDMSGIEVTQMLLSRENTKHVPIVAMTSHTELEYKMRCYSVGMVGYYGKPKNIQDIQAMVKSHTVEKPERLIPEKQLKTKILPVSKQGATVLFH